MSIPIDVIDPEAGYRAWVQQYLWHIDQIPLLIETAGILALPNIGVSRGGSQFDRPQITGGGYYDNVPIRDDNATATSHELWVALVAYLNAIRAHGLTATNLADEVPADPDVARRRAYDAIGWLADHVEQIVDWADLGPLEEELFEIVRRSRGRFGSTGTARRARPRLCTTCGEHAVIVDWIEGANGSPKPIQVGVCKSCNETYVGADTGSSESPKKSEENE